jgi:Bacterial membrane protein YfhO
MRGKSLLWAAGPVLIVATVLFVMRAYAFEGRLLGADVVQFFLPNHCHLGESLRDGQIPAWNPYSMGGVPFAADPQSGWMSLPAMLLYTFLPCETAMRWFITLQPVLAGLGAYAFLRSEGVGRIGSTIAGLGLGIPMSASTLVLSLPFAGTLAWIPLMLACVSRALATRTWPLRIVWTVAAAIAWGQVAAALLSHGLLVGTVALICYLTFKLFALRANGRLREGLAVTALMVVAFPAVNLAYLLPRLAYLPQTIVGLGYDELERVSARFASGVPDGLGVEAAANPTWVLKLATYPGLYLGAVVLIFSLAALFTQRHRQLLFAFGCLGMFGYLFSLESIARLEFWTSLPLSDIYTHNPGRLRLAVFLALPLLAGVGVDGWMNQTGSRPRLAYLLPSVAVWMGVPLLLGVGTGHLSMLFIGLVLGSIVLLAAAVRWQSLLVLLPVVVAIELVALPLTGVAAEIPFKPEGLEGSWSSPPMSPISYAKDHTVDRVYLSEGSIADHLRSQPFGRYLTLRREATRWSNRAVRRTADPLGIRLQIENVQAYNPVQLTRYWTFVSAVNRKAFNFRVSIFARPRRVALDLLNVRYIVGPAGASRSPSPYASFFRRTIDADPVLIENGLSVWEVTDPSERAEVVDSWTVVSQDDALRGVTSEGFDSSAHAFLEDDPGLSQSEGSGLEGEVDYEQLSPGHARVRVTTPSSALVVVRTPYDPNWRATVDGTETEVLAADYLVQAVPVEAGSHIIDLTYEDSTIGYGVAGSAISLALLLGGAGFLKLLPTLRRVRNSRRANRMTYREGP